MKLDSIQGNRDVQSSSEEQIDYGIDGSQMWLLYEILSQYSNPVGSIVRELTTNAIDAHIESGQNKRVVVRITEDNPLTGKQASFEVEDFGTGISPDRLKDIYSKFLASSKRETNDEHGAYGLGSKSPFSYTDLFYMRTRFNGIEYFYAMHKGKNSPRIDLLSKEDTVEENGTLVSVNIKSGDIYKFKKEVKRQLAYFDNVHHEGTSISNNYRIIEGDNFLCREHANELNLNELHICLGKVYYPINFSNVSLENKKSSYSNSTIPTPIALKFKIGELPIVWSRENIEYTDQAIEAIEAKYKEACEELEQLFKSKTDSVDTVEEFFTYQSQLKNNELELIDGITIKNIDSMIEQEIHLDKYDVLPNNPEPREVLDLIYKVHKDVKSGIANSVTSSYDKSVSRLTNKGLTHNGGINYRGNNPFYIEEAYNTKKNKYIFEELGYNQFYLISKLADSEKPSEAKILGKFGYDALQFDQISNQELSLIKEYTRECIKIFKKNIRIYEDIDVPDDFDPTPSGKVREDIYDPSSDKYDPELKIHFKQVNYDDYRYYSRSIKGFTVYEPTIGHLLEYRKQLRIYGFQEDSDLLEEVGELFTKTHVGYNFWKHYNMPNPERFMILKIAKGKEEILLDLSDNAIHVNEFINKRHKILTRELTYYYIYKVLEVEAKYPIKLIEKDSMSLIEELEMKEYKSNIEAGMKVVSKALSRDFSNYRIEQLPNSLKQIFESPAFLDKDILDTYNRAMAYINKYPLIFNLISKDLGSEENRELLKSELKYYLKGKDKINPVLRMKLENKKKLENMNELDRILDSINI